MVIDRLGTDLQKKFEECGKRFSRKVVLQLGLGLVSDSSVVGELHSPHELGHVALLLFNHCTTWIIPCLCEH